jgi:hypothetical protein
MLGYNLKLQSTTAIIKILRYVNSYCDHNFDYIDCILLQYNGSQYDYESNRIKNHGRDYCAVFVYDSATRGYVHMGQSIELGPNIVTNNILGIFTCLTKQYCNYFCLIIKKVISRYSIIDWNWNVVTNN